MKFTLDPSNYSFNATAKTITFSGIVPAHIGAIMNVTNATRGVLYFQPQGGIALSGTYVPPTLTLNCSTSGHANGDKLLIVYDDGKPEISVDPLVQKGGGVVTATTQRVTLAEDGPGVATLISIDTDLGALNVPAASTDTGSFSLIALIKRGLQNWTTLLTRIPELSSGSVPTAPNIQRGGGAITGTTTRVTLATDGPGVTSLSSIDTKTPALQSGAVPVGDNGSSLTVDARAYRAAVDVTRPANTTAYAAGDVIGTGSGDDAIITLANIGPSGGFVVIQSIELVLGIASVPSGMSSFRLHLYTVKPAAAADNTVFDVGSNDRSGYIGYIDFPTPVDLGSTCFTQVDMPGKLIKLASNSTSLFCELQTVGGFTPAANSEVYSLRAKTLEAGL